MSGPPLALQLHRTTVWCGATEHCVVIENRPYWQYHCRPLLLDTDPGRAAGCGRVGVVCWISGLCVSACDDHFSWPCRLRGLAQCQESQVSEDTRCPTLSRRKER